MLLAVAGASFSRAMLNGPLLRIASFWELGSDPLKSGSILLSLMVLLGGLVFLGSRARAAWNGREPARSLAACRMTAVLGALGGFVAYLRELPHPDARLGLALGGVSALPWAAAIALELARRRGKGGGRRGGRE